MFFGPSDRNELFHTPLLSKMWNLGDRPIFVVGSLKCIVYIHKWRQEAGRQMSIIEILLSVHVVHLLFLFFIFHKASCSECNETCRCQQKVPLPGFVICFIILLKMSVVVYTKNMKYIHISCVSSQHELLNTLYWILQPCITGQTSQRPFDWSVPPMMSGSCSGIREGYAGASRNNVRHLHSQDGWHYVRLVHSVLFSGDLGREHTWQSPGHSVRASKPFYHQSPVYPVVCSWGLLVSRQYLQVPINLRGCNQPRSQAPEQNCSPLLCISRLQTSDLRWMALPVFLFLCCFCFRLLKIEWVSGF